MAQTTISVISSTPDKLVIQLKCNPASPDDLAPLQVLIGLPNSNLPKINTQFGEVLPHPFQEIKISETKWINYQKVNGLQTGTLQISPITPNGEFFQYQTITIQFSSIKKQVAMITPNQEKLLAPKIINWEWAKNWTTPTKQSLKKVKSIPEGHWIQMIIRKDGMYKITGEELLKHISSTQNFDPRSIMLFTGSAFGRDRTYDLTQKISAIATNPDNLVELPISIEGESDGNLGNDDILYFYARGPSGFEQAIDKVNWHQNLYFTESAYWLLIPSNTSLRGKRVETGIIVPDGPLNVDYGVSYLHYETDLVNPHKSGLAWGNSAIRQGGSFSQVVELVHPISSTTASGSFGMIGKESVPTRYGNTKHEAKLSLNSQELKSLTWSNLGLKSGSFSIPAGTLTHGSQSFQITNSSENPNSEPFFDFLTLSYTRKLSYSSSFEFFSPVSANDMTFSISGSKLRVWNISNTTQPINRPLQVQDNTTTMRVSLPADTLQRFYVFNLDDLPTVPLIAPYGPKDWERIRNTTLGADHLIVGPQIFSSDSAPLMNHRGNSFYVNLKTIYDEFSGGNQDPVAIRHFLQWTQEHWAQKPYTVLFMGDADYDYRNITGQSNMQVPTIEVGTTYSHATDDRLVSFNGVIPEMATGRFPARTQEEVTAFVDKIIAFETAIPSGLWKQHVTLVADDPARPERESYELSMGKSHTLNSERLTKSIPGFMEVKKLYMVDYPEVSDGSAFGVIKPDATQALFDQISSGTAIINFIGHGNPTQWAQEKLLIINETRNDIQFMKAEMKLPIWVAGTCNWGHFDQIGSESFAEKLIRTPMDAASAIITTTRGITVSSNIHYLEKIFSAFFPQGGITDATLGMVLQSVKTGGSDGELFHLFGDPAMKLPIPSQLVSDGTVTPDTLATLDVGTLNGSSPFDSGEGFLVFEDGPSSVTKTFNFASSKEQISYLKNGPTLFRGAFTFEGATLAPQFRVPKDITYSDKPAKVRFSISSNTNDEAIGAVSGIQLTLGSPSNDTDGPIITFETESGRMLRNGDHMSTEEKLIIRLSDPLGINLTGEKGHELYLIHPETEDKTLAIDQFIYDVNSLNTGTIQHKIQTDQDQLSLGVSAWDNANNPTETQIDLTLIKSKKLDLLHVFNFPNPFAHETQFTFELTGDAQVSVTIYSLAGRR
ncbi:MAG: C25 family cysteine peptidase, partial [Candidatus Marinimicrobia bacterium]|nr:C25 family cysteine peptidase [Candidatus Neomarinimicrobiota bacterium]